METVIKKYNNLRPYITEGCLFICSKNQIVSKTIRYCDDNAEFSHIGIIFEKLGRLFIIDSNAKGVHPDLLSFRIKDSKDFIIIKPKIDIITVKTELEKAIDRADRGINYDFSNGIKELINRQFKINLRITQRDGHDICSDFTFEYAKALNMLTRDVNKLRILFPQDYIRYNNGTTTTILKD